MRCLEIILFFCLALHSVSSSKFLKICLNICWKNKGIIYRLMLKNLKTGWKYNFILSFFQSLLIQRYHFPLAPLVCTHTCPAPYWFNPCIAFSVLLLFLFSLPLTSYGLSDLMWIILRMCNWFLSPICLSPRLTCKHSVSVQGTES